MGSFISWFERSYKVVIVVLVAIMAFALVVLAVQHVNASRPAAGAEPEPILTFGTPRPVAVFIGDSYTAGAGSSADDRTFPSIVGRTQGWQLTNLGRGGTGYLANVKVGAQNACARAYCPNYPGMLDQVRALHPSIIVVSGGRNDVSAPITDETAAVKSFFQQLHAAAPDARVIVTSPIWDDDPAPANLNALRDVVKQQAADAGATYLDLGEPIAGHADYVSGDGVHPNDAGYAAIAAAIDAHL